MEFLSGIFVGYFLNFTALAILLGIGIFLEHIEYPEVAVFTGLLSSVICYKYFNLTLIDTALYITAYIVIGIVWSFWRYKRYVEIKLLTMSSCYYLLEPGRNISKIVSWILVWPFSVVDSGIGDIINLVTSMVKNVLHSVYARIYTSLIPIEPKSETK